MTRRRLFGLIPLPLLFGAAPPTDTIEIASIYRYSDPEAARASWDFCKRVATHDTHYELRRNGRIVQIAYPDHQ